MDLDEARSRLTVGVDAIGGLVAGVANEEATFRPWPGAASVLDVLVRLTEEEADGFRGRLRGALQGMGPSSDGRAGERVAGLGARAGSVREALVRFREEREVSLAWLATLGAPDLRRANEAAVASPCVDDLLASWVANDLERMDELVRLRLAWWTVRVAPFRTEAGRDAVVA